MDVGGALDVLIVEDEVLLATELQCIVQEAGFRDVGLAKTAGEAVELACRLTPDLALVDIHLEDGPTGVEAARLIAENCGAVVLFMTANFGRVPADFAGACGVIGKPYSEHAVRMALAFVGGCLRDGHASGPLPVGLRLSPDYAERWCSGLPKSA